MAFLQLAQEESDENIRPVLQLFGTSRERENLSRFHAQGSLQVASSFETDSSVEKRSDQKCGPGTAVNGLLLVHHVYAQLPDPAIALPRLWPCLAVQFLCTSEDVRSMMGM